MQTIIFSLFILTAFGCNKSPPLPEFYFQCKVDGEKYIPNSCANCKVAKLLGDTTILINGNKGFETIGIGIIKLNHLPITSIIYNLDQNPQQGATYKNSTTLNDQFDTDAPHVGKLVITSLNKATKIIEGTFFFNAYNPVQNKTINITEGKFRRKYTTD